MSKKSIFSLIIALMLTLSVPSGIYAEKENDSKNTTTTTQTKTENKNTEDKNKDDEKKEGKDEEDSFPKLHSNYYLLADLDTGKILYKKNEDKKVYPASTTKILTGIIALERCNLEDTVTATAEAINPIDNTHSNMGILVGEKLTVEQLLYGLLVDSANDAANVLAIHISGTLDEFAKTMNNKALELGAKNSHFVNPHGYHDDDHYTTAEDIAIIAHYAMQNEKFQELVSTSKYQIPATNKYKETRYFSNTNMLISANRTSHHLFKYATGIKTGSTDEAGSCLVASAEKNGTRLFSVVMKCDNEGITDQAYSFTDSRALLDYGFKNYKHMTIAKTTDVVESSKVREAKKGVRVSLSPEEDIIVLLPIDTDLSLIEFSAELNEDIKAPIQKNDILGKVTYTLEGEVLGSAKLVAGNDVERDFFLHIIFTIWDIVSDPIVILGVLFIVLFILYIRSSRRRRRRIRRSKLKHFNDYYDDLPKMRRR